MATKGPRGYHTMVALMVVMDQRPNVPVSCGIWYKRPDVPWPSGQEWNSRATQGHNRISGLTLSHTHRDRCYHVYSRKCTYGLRFPYCQILGFFLPRCFTYTGVHRPLERREEYSLLSSTLCDSTQFLLLGHHLRAPPACPPITHSTPSNIRPATQIAMERCPQNRWGRRSHHSLDHIPVYQLHTPTLIWGQSEGAHLPYPSVPGFRDGLPFNAGSEPSVRFGWRGNGTSMGSISHRPY
jgi:hypothetical protein